MAECPFNSANLCNALSLTVGRSAKNSFFASHHDRLFGLVSDRLIISLILKFGNYPKPAPPFLMKIIDFSMSKDEFPDISAGAWCALQYLNIISGRLGERPQSYSSSASLPKVCTTTLIAGSMPSGLERRVIITVGFLFFTSERSDGSRVNR